MTSPFEYSVAVCAEDDVSVLERGRVVEAGEVEGKSVEDWWGVDGMAVEVREVMDEMDDECEWVDSER